MRSEREPKQAQPLLAKSDGDLFKRSHKRDFSALTKRKKRHSKTPAQEKIPSLEISELTTEHLEQLVSLDLSKNPSATEWKVKAAHELAARYIGGDTHPFSEHKAPVDHVKAYNYAKLEIDTLSIEDIELKFFNIRSANEKDEQIAVAFPWQNVGRTYKKIAHNYPEQKKNINFIAFENLNAINNFIKETNEELRKDKAADANAIILAWEKQIAAARLAEHYRKLKKEKRDHNDALAAKFYKETVRHLAEHEPPHNWVTALLLKIVSPRFNAIRLFIIRLNKFLTQINTPLLATPFLKWVATLAGLYFLIELIIDLSIIIKAGLYDAAGEFSPSLERLKLSFWEDNRPSRMANAFVWFSLNLACLLLTIFLAPTAPLLAPLLIGVITIAGCLFDVGAEIGIGIYGFKTIKELLAPVDTELAKLADIDVNKKFSDAEFKQDPLGVTQQKQKITQKIALLEFREQLIKKRTALEINRAYTIVIMSVLTLAAIFIFFPPAALPLAPIIAASAALIVGSVFGGLGKYLFWNAPQFYQSGKEAVLKGCRTIKEFILGKVKAPLVTHTADDWHLNTKQINHSLQIVQLMESKTPPESPQASPTSNPKPPKPLDYGYAAALHRSPSGTLLTDSRVPESKHVNFSTYVTEARPKNLKPM